MTVQFEVVLSQAATRQFKKFPDVARKRLKSGLGTLADETSKVGTRSGKKVKTIQGTVDTFHRLRVGDYRVMYDVIEQDHVILILGVVHRGDLEKWLRNR